MARCGVRWASGWIVGLLALSGVQSLATQVPPAAAARPVQRPAVQDTAPHVIPPAVLVPPIQLPVGQIVSFPILTCSDTARVTVGAHMVTRPVPSLWGLTQSAARDALRAQRIFFRDHGVRGPGTRDTIIGQAPPPGQRITQRDTVVFCWIQPWTVPAVTGLAVRAAVAMLADSGYRADPRDSLVTSAAAAGEVLGQAPAAGTPADSGSVVTLYVGSVQESGNQIPAESIRSIGIIDVTPPPEPSQPPWALIAAAVTLTAVAGTQVVRARRRRRHLRSIQVIPRPDAGTQSLDVPGRPVDRPDTGEAVDPGVVEQEFARRDITLVAVPDAGKQQLTPLDGQSGDRGDDP